MSSILVEGWDAYNGSGINTGLQSRWTAAGSFSSLSQVAGAYGGYAITNYGVGTSAGYIQRYLAAPVGQFSFGVNLYLPYSWAWLVSGDADYYCPVWFGNAFGIWFGGDGAVYVGRCSNAITWTNIGQSAPNAYPDSAFFHLEVVCTAISTTVGAVTVYIDGDPVITVSGVNNDGAAAGTTERVLLGNRRSNLGLRYDDLYMDDVATQKGPTKIETLRPDADTAQKDWAPSTGAVNFAMIDEDKVDTADYVSADATNEEDMYDFSALSGTPTTIYTVAVSIAAAKTDAGTRKLAMPVDDGTTKTDGPDFTLSVTPAVLQDKRFLDTKPSGGSWDATSVNAIKAGIKVTA